MANVTSGSQPGRSGARVALWILEVVLFLFWFAVAVGFAQLTMDRVGPLVIWGTTIVFMVVLLALAGHEINGQWFGVLIDSRNKISLSRLQITLWTVLVLSAYLTIALPRVSAMVLAAPAPAAAPALTVTPTPTATPKSTATPAPGAVQTSETVPAPEGAPTVAVAQALDIRFPEELIVAMGISAASFAGSSLIMSNKKGKQIKVDARLSPDAAQARRDQAEQALKDAEDALLDAVQIEASRKDDLDKAKQALAGGTGIQDKVDAAQIKYNSALIDKDKATQDRDVKKKTLETAASDLADILATQGLLHKNADPSEARWVDLFRGEEIGNFKLIDMSKVQMLFFTVVIIAAYAAAISGVLRDLTLLRTSAFIAFPGFSESLNFLLGISHGTYLSVKTIDQS
jgi:hypothetical protein